MRNLTQKRGAGSPLTVHLEQNTGIWLEVINGIVLRIEALPDGNVVVYNSTGKALRHVTPNDDVPSRIELLEGGKR